MELIIFYSPDHLTRLRDITDSLGFNQISFIPYSIPRVWDISGAKDLVPLMSRYSHSLFLMDQRVWDSAFFTFAVGYAFGKHMSTALFILPGLEIPPEWPEIAHIFADVDNLLLYCSNEHRNHHKMLKEQRAKKDLETRGKELSSNALLEAVEEGDALSLSLFLEAGYSPDFCNKKGVPLLCLAVRNNHPGAVRELIAAGASLDHQSQDRGNTPLMDAAAEGHEDLVALLLEKGAGVDSVSKSGQTALIMAAGQGKPRICQLLVEAGADPDKTDLLGMSARLYAGLFKKDDVKNYFESLKIPS